MSLPYKQKIIYPRQEENGDEDTEKTERDLLEQPDAHDQEHQGHDVIGEV